MKPIQYPIRHFIGRSHHRLKAWPSSLQFFSCGNYSGFRPSQWETTLQCNVVSHWSHPSSLIGRAHTHWKHCKILWLDAKMDVQKPHPCCTTIPTTLCMLLTLCSDTTFVFRSFKLWFNCLWYLMIRCQSWYSTQAACVSSLICSIFRGSF